MNTVSLSNRGYTMLMVFATENSYYRMTIEQAGQFDQRAFRSMLMREYVVWDRVNKGFRLTSIGRDAFVKFQETDILRKVASLDLTAYFKMPHSLHVIHKRKVA